MIIKARAVILIQEGPGSTRVLYGFCRFFLTIQKHACLVAGWAMWWTRKQTQSAPLSGSQNKVLYGTVQYIILVCVLLSIFSTSWKKSHWFWVRVVSQMALNISRVNIYGLCFCAILIFKYHNSVQYIDVLYCIYRKLIWDKWLKEKSDDTYFFIKKYSNTVLSVKITLTVPPMPWTLGFLLTLWVSKQTDTPWITVLNNRPMVRAGGHSR